MSRIDPERFRRALQRADATVVDRRATMKEAARYTKLDQLSVSREKQQRAVAALQSVVAEYQRTLADHAVAQLNRDRSVKGAVEGVVTNIDLQPGDYVTYGKSVATLIDSAILRVEGYFEEKGLAHIHAFDPIRPRLMDDAAVLHGLGIATDIADRERTGDTSLLDLAGTATSARSALPSERTTAVADAGVNATFGSVRQARCVPARVKPDNVPDKVKPAVGRTASVAVGDADHLTLTSSQEGMLGLPLSGKCGAPLLPECSATMNGRFQSLTIGDPARDRRQGP